MNLIRGNSIVPLAFLALAIVTFFPCLGRAQDVIRGEFNLSREVYWQDSVLPKGDYVYFVDSNEWPSLVRVEQKRGSFSGVFVPRLRLRSAKDAGNGIALASAGHDVYIQSLRLRELGGELYFSAPHTDEDKPDADEAHATQPAVIEEQAARYLTIINPNHEKISTDKAEKVYLKVCEGVARQFNHPDPIRPRVVLRLGAGDNVLRYPIGEIQLKKWDEYRFADGVVDLAIHSMLPPGDRARLGSDAVRDADATVNVCELKACAN